MDTSGTATLLVACRDRAGIVAAISGFVYRNDGNILDADQHSERRPNPLVCRNTLQLLQSDLQLGQNHVLLIQYRALKLRIRKIPEPTAEFRAVQRIKKEQQPRRTRHVLSPGRIR